MERRPDWLKIRLASNSAYRAVRELIQDKNLHTVCRSARCPNIGDCWSRKTATFMILGDVCTRNCQFCAVTKGQVLPPDPEEPKRVALAVKKLGLRHAVITSVTRDDLPDGGSELFVKTVQEIRKISPSCSVEILIPDFQGNGEALRAVFDALPDILNHNLEVVPRLYQKARPKADFNTSLDILRRAKKAGLISKTGIMVGLGETHEELRDLFKRLSDIELDILTIGQYLQPTANNLRVIQFYKPEVFQELKILGEQSGIRHVESGPLVRSSYHADEQITHMDDQLRE
ncbi:MAG: lipoyl synthase [bacterium]|nr:MAG: lipoyl synthase [bacterium]